MVTLKSSQIQLVQLSAGWQWSFYWSWWLVEIKDKHHKRELVSQTKDRRPDQIPFARCRDIFSILTLWFAFSKTKRFHRRHICGLVCWGTTINNVKLAVLTKRNQNLINWSNPIRNSFKASLSLVMSFTAAWWAWFTLVFFNRERELSDKRGFPILLAQTLQPTPLQHGKEW